MRIDICCYETDSGTAIEIADALIENILSADGLYVGKRILGEIAEHIQVYLKYSTKGSEQNAFD